MKPTYFFRSSLVILLITGSTTLGWAGEPTEKIKLTTDKILSVLADPALKSPAKEKERRKLIRSAVDERFDWEEMARRSLARHWAQRTEAEKKEFVPLFADVLDRAYMSKVEGYAGEKVRYEGETVEGEYASVKTKIAADKSREIPVEYRVRKKGNDWKVYDVVIEGVSLVNNYRTQFESLLAQSSFENLLKKLREKAAGS